MDAAVADHASEAVEIAEEVAETAEVVEIDDKRLPLLSIEIEKLESARQHAWRFFYPDDIL